jgi:hypothetical protein
VVNQILQLAQFNGCSSSFKGLLRARATFLICQVGTGLSSVEALGGDRSNFPGGVRVANRFCR